MRALSIRQPYAELILRGEKTIEYRSRPTKIIGERFCIYASLKWAGVNGHDAKGIKEGEAPTGVIVGTAVIRKCVPNNGHYEWHLSDVKRMKRPRRVKGKPQPVWFRPW
jgi:hypothetical protein